MRLVIKKVTASHNSVYVKAKEMQCMTRPTDSSFLSLMSTEQRSVGLSTQCSAIWRTIREIHFKFSSNFKQ